MSEQRDRPGQQTLGELEKELKERREMLNNAEREESHARNRATEARNALNDTQKKIDAIVEAFRTGAARDTYWGQERNRVGEVRSTP